MTTEKSLTAERLREVLDYDPATGLFTRKVRTARNVQVGDVAGSLNGKGYICIRVDGRSHKAHRLAWLYVHGVWPQSGIDHINGIKDDNHIINLREATHSDNQQNLRKPHADNKIGLLGVSRSQGKFKAQIKVYGKVRTIGRFHTPEAAHAAYLKAKRQLHPFGTL